MNKIIIYNPKSASSGHRLPLSILQIGASIHGIFDYVFVDGNFEDNPFEKINSYLQTGEYTIFASTVMPGPQTVEAIPLTKKIKLHYPEVFTIWGGYFPSMYFKVVLESGFVDFVIRGIGDYAFPELLKTLENNTYESYNRSSDTMHIELSKIKNLIFNHKNKIIRNIAEHKILYEKLNHLPYGHLNLFYPLKNYFVKTFMGSRTASYQSSMGCLFECNFCATVPMFNSRLSVQPIDDVYNDIKYLKENFGVNAIEFNDNDFFYSEERVAQLARLLQGEKIAWWAYGRIDIINRYKDETLLLMKESGCKMIFFGAESGDAQMLQSMNKGGKASIDQSIQLLERLKKHAIIPEYSFVLGLPARTKQFVANQIDNDLKFIKAIKKKHPETEIILNFYRPIGIESSKTYQMALEYGFRFPDKIEGWLDPERNIHTFGSVSHYAWFPKKSARKIRNFATVLHAYYPSVSDFQLTKFQKKLMKILSYLRYQLEIYSYPIELEILQKFWLRYKSPEEEGFYSE